MSKAAFYSFIVLFASFNARAAEVDHFTPFYQSLSDSAEIVNKEANEALDLALEKLNREKNISCDDEEELYDILREQFNNHVFGEFTKKLITEFDIDRKNTRLEDSVYKNWSVFNGLLMGTSAGFKRQLVISDIIKIGDYEVGIDKFEHLFGQGFAYFRINYLEEKGALEAAKKGFVRERRVLGGSLITNGIFSYGDLAANFNGMRFWNHILQKRDDILGEEYNVGPIVTCTQNKWKRVGRLDFRNYMDDSMNEAINCSKYSTKSGVKKMKRQLKSMKMNCPMDRSDLNAMIEKYGDYAPWIINKNGVGRSLPNLNVKKK